MCMANTAALIRHIIINESTPFFNRKSTHFSIFFMKIVLHFPFCHACAGFRISFQGEAKA